MESLGRAVQWMEGLERLLELDGNLGGGEFKGGRKVHFPIQNNLSKRFSHRSVKQKIFLCLIAELLLSVGCY